MHTLSAHEDEDESLDIQDRAAPKVVRPKYVANTLIEAEYSPSDLDYQGCCGSQSASDNDRQKCHRGVVDHEPQRDRKVRIMIVEFLDLLSPFEKFRGLEVAFPGLVHL